MGETVRLDLRAVLALAALGIVVLTIILVELCGSEGVDEQTVVPNVSPQPQDTPEPVEPTPTLGENETPPPTSTPAPPEPGGEERDATRQEDLAALQQALEDYRSENDSYPSTGGNIQSLCVFPGDAGCELEDAIGSIPVDPLAADGQPASENGYWYASDGSQYTIYAQREADAAPECDELPAHLEGFGVESAICVSGP